MPCQDASNDEEADQLWSDGDLDWLHTRPDDVLNDQEPGKIILPLP